MACGAADAWCEHPAQVGAAAGVETGEGDGRCCGLLCSLSSLLFAPPSLLLHELAALGAGWLMLVRCRNQPEVDKHEARVVPGTSGCRLHTPPAAAQLPSTPAYAQLIYGRCTGTVVAVDCTSRASATDTWIIPAIGWSVRAPTHTSTF
jgi:hypothetical protein